MNKKSVEERTENFINRLKKVHKDRYTYIDGYKGLHYEVKVRCNECKREFSAVAGYLVRGGKYPFKCECEQPVKNDEKYFKSLIDNLENKNIEYLGCIHSEKLKNVKIKVRCKKCKSIYIYDYSRVRDGNINCCNMKKATNYETYSNRLIREIFPKGKSMTYKNINNYEAVIKREMDYIMDGSRKIKFDREELEKILLVKAKKLKEEWNVGECSICGKLKHGNGRNGLLKEFGSDNICRECYIDYVECECCNKTKKRSKFRYLKEAKEFHSICLECEGKED